jgi:hypothetical protein
MSWRLTLVKLFLLGVALASLMTGAAMNRPIDRHFRIELGGRPCRIDTINIGDGSVITGHYCENDR